MENPIVTGYPPPLMASPPPIDPHAAAYARLPGTMGGITLNTPPSQYQTPAKTHATAFIQELPAEPVVFSPQAQQQHVAGAHPSPAPSTYSQPSSNADLPPQSLSPAHTGSIHHGIHSAPNGPMMGTYNGQTPSHQGSAREQPAAVAYHAAGTPVSNHSSPAVASSPHGQSPVAARLQGAPSQTLPPFPQQNAQYHYSPVAQQQSVPQNLPQQPTYQPSVQHAMPPAQASYAQPPHQLQQNIQQPQYHSQQSLQQSQVILQHTQPQYQHHHIQQSAHHGQPLPQSHYTQQQPLTAQQQTHVQPQQGRPASQIITQYNPQHSQCAQSAAQMVPQGPPQPPQQPPLQQYQPAQANPQLQALQQQRQPSSQSTLQQPGQPQQFVQPGVPQQLFHQSQQPATHTHLVQQPYHQQPQSQVLHQRILSQPQVPPSTTQQQGYQTVQTAGQGTLRQSQNAQPLAQLAPLMQQQQQQHSQATPAQYHQPQQQQVHVPIQAQGHSQHGVSLPTKPQQPAQYTQQQPQAQLQPGTIYYNGQQYVVASPQLPVKQAKPRVPSSGASQKAAAEAMAKGFKRAFKSVDKWSQKHMAGIPQPSQMKPAGQAPAQTQMSAGQATAYATAATGYSTMPTAAKPQVLMQNSQYAVQQPFYQAQVPGRVPVGGHPARPVGMAAAGTVQINNGIHRPDMGHRMQQVSNPVNQFQPTQPSISGYQQPPLPTSGSNNAAGPSASPSTGQGTPSQSSPGQTGHHLPQNPLPAGQVGYGGVPNHSGTYMPVHTNPQHHLAVGHGAGTTNSTPNTIAHAPTASPYNSPGMYAGFSENHISRPETRDFSHAGAPNQPMYTMAPPPAQSMPAAAPLVSGPGQNKGSQGLAAYAPKVAAGAAAIALVGTAAALGTKGGLGKKFRKGHHGGGGGHTQEEAVEEDQQQAMSPGDAEAVQDDSFGGGGDLSGLSGGFDPSGEASSAFAAQSAMADVGAANSMSLIDGTSYTTESAADIGARGGFGGDPAAYDPALATETAFADQGAANSMSLIDDTTYTVDPDVGAVYAGGGGDPAAYDPALATEAAFADQGAANSMSLIDDTTYTVEPAADPSAGYYDPSAAGGGFMPVDTQLYQPAYDPSQFAAGPPMADPSMMGYADQGGVFDGGAALDSGVLEDSGGLSESVAAAAESSGGIDWGGLMDSVSSWGF